MVRSYGVGLTISRVAANPAHKVECRRPPLLGALTSVDEGPRSVTFSSVLNRVGAPEGGFSARGMRGEMNSRSKA